jgi:uncharacterized protein (DUF1800 family)
MASLVTHTGLLTERLAAHLLRRTTFGPTRAQITALTSKTASQAVDALLLVTPAVNKPIDPLTNTTWIDETTTQNNDPLAPNYHSMDGALQLYLGSWFIDNARLDNTIRSKMVLFLHQNWMATRSAYNSIAFYDYLKTLEFYAVGSYKTLAYKITRSNTMLRYLNGNQNTVTAPNENYSREFLELFTIGKGPQIAPGNYTNYTEADIKTAARVLTGLNTTLNNATVDADTNIRWGIIQPARHDATSKTFSTAFGSRVIAGSNTQAGIITEINSFIDMVFAQQETARNICRKLYRFFVSSKITAEIETDIINPLAVQLLADNYVLKNTLKKLLTSRHFYDLDDAVATDELVGKVLKSPLDLLLHIMRFFGIQPNSATPNNIWNSFYVGSVQRFILANGSLPLFAANDVSGYEAYFQAPQYDRLWFNTASLNIRYTLPAMIIENKRKLIAGNFLATIDMALWTRNNISAPATASVIVDELVNYLLPEKPAAGRRDYFINLLLGNLSQINWGIEWNNYIATNNSSSVKPRLDILFKGITGSQEFQLQ